MHTNPDTMESAMSTLSSGSALVSVPVEPQNETPSFAILETELVASIGLPISTYRACVQGGRGPRTFKLGRRNYILRNDWEAWLEHLADIGGLKAVER